jgi:hypothetical protein
VLLSFLQEDYYLHQIQSKTALGKSTIGRIKKEVDADKENLKGGHPFKLSPCDKQSVSHQITSGRLDNAVQATHYINIIISNPVSPQTIRNTLKEQGFKAVAKKKCPLLKKTVRLPCLQFARYHENWTMNDWKRVL